MVRITRYSKPYSVRFRKLIEKKMLQICLEKETSASDIIQQAVECYVNNDKCIARRRSA